MARVSMWECTATLSKRDQLGGLGRHDDGVGEWRPQNARTRSTACRVRSGQTDAQVGVAGLDEVTAVDGRAGQTWTASVRAVTPSESLNHHRQVEGQRRVPAGPVVRTAQVGELRSAHDAGLILDDAVEVGVEGVGTG